MDNNFDSESSQSFGVQSASGNCCPGPTNPVQTPTPQAAPKKTSGWRIFLNILLGFSVAGNILLFLGVIGLSLALFGSYSTFSSTFSPADAYIEQTLKEGSLQNKIAVINLEGIIDQQQSEHVRLQLEKAADDQKVKALIIRIDSPGGMVSSSDQIYYYINRFRTEHDKPVIAMMQNIAASGGYYSSVACQHIIAEPTVITGSIGVIMNHLVIKDLLEQKLGISPVTLKSGEKKDWPSLFEQTTEQQKQYLDQRVIQPAFQRFLQVVCEGRKDKLSEEQVRQLADGGIYTAPQALENRLIDQIGYMDDAIELAEKLAGISDAGVVEYSPRRSIFSYLGAESATGISLDKKTIETLLTPRLMYLWDGMR